MKVKIKNIYCIICGKYKKLKNLTVPYKFKRKLFLFIICAKCNNED